MGASFQQPGQQPLRPHDPMQYQAIANQRSLAPRPQQQFAQGQLGRTGQPFYDPSAMAQPFGPSAQAVAPPPPVDLQRLQQLQQSYAQPQMTAPSMVPPSLSQQATNLFSQRGGLSAADLARILIQLQGR